MKMLIIFILTTLVFSNLVFAKQELQGTVVRDEKGFPRCYVGQGENYFFDWHDETLSRKIMVLKTNELCRNWRLLFNYTNSENGLSWNVFIAEEFPQLPKNILGELRQVAAKTNRLLVNDDPEQFVNEGNIKSYTLELNRELSRQYGQIFSAKVFKAFVEKNERNKEFKNEVLKSFETKWKDRPFSHLKNKISLVVSFGLGWEENYSQATPLYIREFLQDIKSLGLPTRFLKKTPWGSIRQNVQLIKKQLREELDSGREIIIISLCKGTPEVLLAESLIHLETNGQLMNRILGHVNLSGMLDGTFYSDKASELMLPKIAGPILKLIPMDSARESTKMFGAINLMKSDIIERAVREASRNLPKDLLYINVTGAPMSDQVFNENSPVVPVVRYTQFAKLSSGANDGFLELPNTLIPDYISNNQITLFLDSTHLLSDGMLDGHKLHEESKRRALYNATINHVIREATNY